MAATLVAALVSALAIATLTKFLLSTELQEKRKIGCFHHRRVLRALPLQALKIIVVVWQILTQVCAISSMSYMWAFSNRGALQVELAMIIGIDAKCGAVYLQIPHVLEGG